jgi:hypothetical protein
MKGQVVIGNETETQELWLCLLHREIMTITVTAGVLYLVGCLAPTRVPIAH